MIRNLAIFIVIVLVKTSTCYADVLVTEINWMGSSDSQFAEWIEFYNTGDEDINMSGWKLYEAGGGTLVFTFTKIIPKKGYLLLERTTSSSPDPVPGINDEAGSFGGSGLSNSGEYLVLKDSGNSVVQGLNFSGGWPAGESDTKKTMQWDGTKWVTATATPKADLNPTTTGEEPIAPPSGTSWVPEKFEPKIILTVPKTIYADVLYEYEAKTYLEYGLAYNGVFVWNMGDGTIYKSSTPQIVSHSYKYPGTYIVSFGYYGNPYEKKPILFAKEKRSVEASSVSLKVIPEKGFEFNNNTDEDFDLSNWLIKLSDDSTLSIPNLSLVAAKSSVIIPFYSLGMSSYSGQARLMTPQWVEVASSEKEKNISNNQSVRSPYLDNKSTVLGANAVSSQEFFNFESKKLEDDKANSNKNYTKIIFFSVALFIVIILFIVLEREVALEKEE
jgi:hypothetical protein